MSRPNDEHGDLPVLDLGDYLDDPVHECPGCGYFTREPRLCHDCQADSR